MGNRESRVVEMGPNEDKEELSGMSTTVEITPDLISSLEGKTASNNTENKSVQMNSEPTNDEKKQLLQQAYQQGAEDYRKKMEAQFQSKLKEQTKKAPVVDETKEAEKVQQMVDQLNQRQFRAPVGVVQCADQRTACLECYRQNPTDVLVCKELADAFVKCAKKVTEEGVKN